LDWFNSSFLIESITWGWTLSIYLLGIVATIDAIWNGRTSQGTLAWVVALVFLPFIALPLYLFFGSRKFHGYKKVRRSSSKVLAKLNKKYLIQPNNRSNTQSAAISPLEKLARLPQTEHNQVKLLINSEQTFQHIFQEIESAQHCILLQFYIINNDRLGQRLKQALISKALEGIDIYFLYDQIGSSNLDNKFLKPMTDAGIHCSQFNPFKFHRRLQLNFRNHKKLIVIDNKISFIGSHNISDQYLSHNVKIDRWRDTHLQINGPAALAAQLAFTEDWHLVKGRIPNLSWQTQATTGNSKVLILSGGPADMLETTSLSFVQLILQAEQRLWIATPYFIPDLKVMGALQLAALKGIDIKILLPKKTDSLLVTLAMKNYVTELSQLGIKFYQYEAGFMHQKVMLIDQTISCIGSANLDNRSLRINFELNAIIECKELASNVEKMLHDDLTSCKPFVEESRFFYKLLSKAARLLSPIL
jgi:cardiolipin synthase